MKNIFIIFSFILFIMTGTIGLMSQNITAYYENSDTWVIDTMMADHEASQIMAFHNDDCRNATNSKASYDVTIFLTPGVPIAAAYLYNEEHLYTLSNFIHFENSLSALIAQGNYELLICYKRTSNSCVSMVFRKDIVIDDAIKFEVLEEEATHEVNFEFFNENGTEVTLDNTSLFTAMFIYEVPNRFFFNYTVSNHTPCLKISDVESEYFQLFNVNVIYPPDPHAEPMPGKSFYVVVNNPVKNNIDNKILFSNNYNLFTLNTFTFPADSLFHSDFILTDMRFGQFLKPHYFGYQGDARYRAESIRLYSAITPFNTVFRLFVQPFCAYAPKQTNYNLAQEMSGRIRSNIFTFTENDQLLNMWFDPTQSSASHHNTSSLESILKHHYSNIHELEFGQAAPVFYVQHRNGNNSPYPIRSAIYPYGRHGEWRETDYLHGNVQFFCDGELLFNDSLYKWQGLSTGKRRECDLIVTSGKTIYDEKEHYSIAKVHINQRVADSDPPTFSMFRILNHAGNISNYVKEKANAKIEFTAADYVDANGRLVYKEAAEIEAYWSTNDTGDWFPLTINEITEKFDSITGNFYSIDVDQIKNEAPAWINIKLICKDKSGNSMTQEFFPAFYMHDYTEGIFEHMHKKKSRSYAYPNPFSESVSIVLDKPVNGDVQLIISDISGKAIYSQTEHCFNRDMFNIQLSDLTENAVYIYTVITPDDIFTGKIFKQ